MNPGAGLLADLALNARCDLALVGAFVSLLHRIAQEAGQAVRDGTGLCSHLVCVERMSTVEIELYFGVVAK